MQNHNNLLGLVININNLINKVDTRNILAALQPMTINLPESLSSLENINLTSNPKLTLNESKNNKTSVIKDKVDPPTYGSQLETTIINLIKEKPIWLKKSLETRLKSLLPKMPSGHSLKIILTKHFYKFSNGPFKHAIISKKYNPLKDQQSIAFQTIALIKNTQVMKSKSPFRLDSRFLSKKKYHCFQFCEIQDKNVENFFKEFFNREKGELSFDWITGWFPKEIYRDLQKLIRINLM